MANPPFSHAAEFRLATWRVFFVAVAMVLGSLPVSGSQSAHALTCSDFTISPASAPTMYIEVGNSYVGTYVAYEITNNSATTIDLYAELDTSAAPSISLATLEDGVYAAGTLAGGQTTVVYIYVTGGVDANIQNLTLNLYDGDPATGTLECASAQSIDAVADIGSSNASGITDVTVDSPPTLGETFTMTVTGDTGNLASNSWFAASPAALDSWDADAFKLIDVVMDVKGFPADVPGGTYASGLPRGGGTYTITYTFEVVQTTSGSIDVQPSNVSNLNGQSNTSEDTSIPVVFPPVGLNTTLAKSVDSSAFPTATYTITFTNTGSPDATMDAIIDSLDPSATFVTGSAQWFDGTSSTPVADPTIDGANVATWVDPIFVITENTADRTLTYDVTYANTPGTYINSAIAQIGEMQVDTTTIEDDAPAIASFTVVGSADLSVSKVDGTDPVVAGETVTYTVTVDNAGPQVANEVVVTDTLPAGTTLVSTSGCAEDPVGAPTCSLSDIATGGSASFDVTVLVAASYTGASITNNVSVTTTSNDNNPANDTASETTTVVQNADLSITKDDGVTSVTAGDGATYTYTLTVSNAGPSDAMNVEVSDTWPAGATQVTVTPSVGSCAGGPSFICSLGTLGPFDVETVLVTYTVASTVEAGSLVNTATVASNTPDAIAANDTDSDTNSVVEDVTLTVDKVFNPATLAAGESGTVEITVTNSGVSDAENLEISDILPAPLVLQSTDCAAIGGAENVAGNDATCTFTGTSLAAAGGSVTWVLNFDVPVGAADQLVNNIATATTDEVVATDSPVAVLAVESEPVLALTKTFVDATVTAGDGVTYTFDILVENTGAGNADNVVISDVVDGAVLVSSTDCAAVGGVDTTTGNSVECTIPTIAPAESVTLTVSYTVPASTDAGTVLNTASAVSDEIVVPVEGSDSVDVVEDVVIVVTKSFADVTVTAGDGVTYSFEILVENTGSSTADNVVISDVVDAALTVTGTDCAGVDATVGNSVSCTVATIGPNGSVTLTVSYTVPASTDAGTVLNTASAVSDEIVVPVEGSDTVDVVEDVVIVVTKSFADVTVAAGDGVTYSFEILVENTGSSTADNVVISDVVDAALTVTGTDCAGVDATVGNSVSCTVATVAAGGSYVLTVSYTVPASTDAGTVLNTASAVSDEVVTPVEGSSSVEVIEDVVLVVTKSFADVTVTAGDGVTYSFDVVVQNTGVSDADNVVISDVVDAALTVTGTDCAGVDATVGNSVSCTVATVAAGGSYVLTVSYTVPASTDAGTVLNTASAVSDEVVTPVEGSSSVEVIEDVVLVVTKSFADVTVTAGDGVTYSFDVVVQNTGVSDADNVVISDVVDAALTVTGTDCGVTGGADATVGNSVECTIPVIAVSGSVTLTVSYTVPASTDAGTVLNTASAVSDEVVTPVEGSSSVEVIEDVVLVVTKSFVEATVTAGDGVTYSFDVVVQNTGVSDADNVVISDVVDAALTVTGTDCAGVDATVGNSVSCTVATVAAGGSYVLTVSYTVPASTDAGTVLNTASAVSDEIVVPVEGSDSVDVVEDVVLVVTKSFADVTVTAGDGVTYSFEILVENTGSSAADNVVISDVVDAALTVTGTDCAGVDATVGNSVGCTVATIGPNGSVTLTVSYTVPASTDAGTVLNTASAVSDEIVVPVEGSDSVDVVEDVVLVVTKSFADVTVTAGDGVTYSFDVVVQNTGVSDADNVVISDVVDAALTVTGTDCGVTGGADATVGNSVECTIPVIAVSGSVTLTVSYTVPASTDAGTVLNTASAVSDEIVVPVEGSDSVDVVEDVVLVVTKSFVEATVTAGDGVTYSFEILVENTGSSAADNVVISDVVDAALTVTGTDCGVTGGADATVGNSVECTVATVAAGGSYVLTVSYTVPASTDAGTVLNTASAVSDEVVTPVEGSSSVEVIEDVVLVVTKSFADVTVTAGDGVTYSFDVVVQNTGVSDADNVVISDVVDAALTVTGTDCGVTGGADATVGNSVECTIPVIAVSGSVTLTVSYTVPASTDAGTVLNTASAVSDEVVTPVEGSSSVEVIEDVVLVVTKSFADVTVTAGDGVTYSFDVVVQNTGVSDADNVVISDVVDAALTVTGTDCGVTGGADATVGNSVECTIPVIAVSGSVTLTVSYTVPASTDAGTVLNTASAVSDEVVTPVEGSSSVEVIEDVVLVVTKSFVEATVTAGDGVTYSFDVVVQNTGVSDADNVVISDVVDAALTVTGTDCAGVDATVGNSVSCTVATVAAGGSYVLTVSYTVPASTDTGTVSNTASAVSDEVVTPVEGSSSVEVIEDVVLVVTKSFADVTVTAGDGVTYSFEILVENTGSSTADNVVISDVVDAALTVTGTDCAGVDATVGNSVSCTVATVAAGGSYVLTVSYTVPASTDAGTVLNTASAVSDEVVTPVEGSSSVEVIEDVVLVVTKSFADVTVTAGDGVTYSFEILVENTGSSAADNVVISDVVDAALTVTGTDCGVTGGADATVGNSVECTVATVAAGGSYVLTVSYTVPASTDAGTVLNTASAVSDEIVVPVEGSDSVDVVEDVVLVVTKSFADVTVTAGDGVTYSFDVVVQNTGVSDADNVVISDVVDAALTVTGTDCGVTGGADATVGNSVECTIPVIAVSGSVTLTVSYTVPASTDAGTVLNTASAVSDEIVVPVEGSDSVDVVEDVVIVVTKSFVEATVTAGDGVTYSFEILVENTGSSTADNVVISDVVDAALTVTGTDCAGVDATAGNSVSCTVATIGPNGSVTLTVSYTVPASTDAGTVLNTASAVSDEVVTPVEGSSSVEVIEDVVLVVTKSFADVTVTAGDGVTYSFDVVVQNTGVSDADNVVISDVVDAALTVTGTDCGVTGGVDATVGNSVSCTVATIGPNGSVTLTVSYTVPASTDAGTVSNTASAVSDEVVTPVEGSSSVEVIEDVELVITKVFAETTVTPSSGNHTFTIVVENVGTSDAKNVMISDLVNASLIVTATDCGGVDTTVGNSVACAIGGLTAGSASVLTVTYDVAADATSGDVPNVATVQSDEIAPVDSAVAAVTVDLPPVAVDDSAVTPFETPVVIDVLANDSDDVTVVVGSITIVSRPSSGSVVVDSAGLVTYTPASGFAGVDTFVYEVCDGFGSCDTATVEVTVILENEPPVWVGPESATFSVGFGNPLSPLLFEDPEGADVVVSIVDGSLPSGVTLNPDGTFGGTAQDSGTFVVTYQACDELGACTTLTVTLQVLMLPVTGTTVLPWLVAATLLTLLGVLAMRVSRRRWAVPFS